MPDTNRDGYIKLGYEIDQGSINAVNQATAAVESRLAGLEKTTASISDAAVKTGTSLKDAFSRSEAAIKADQKAVDDLRKSLSEAKDEAENLNKASSGGGSKLSVEGLRRTGGALSALGADGVGSGISQLGALGEVAKEFKNIGDAAKGLASSAVQLPGLLGALSQAGAGLGAAAGTTAASIGALAVPIIAIAAPVGALALALGELKNRFDQGHNAVQQFLSDQAKEVELRIQANEKAKTMTSEELKNRQDAIQQELAERSKANKDLIAQDAGLRRQYAETGDLLKKAALADSMKQIGAQVDEQNKHIKALSEEYKNNQTVLDPLIKKREEETAAIEGTLNAIEKKIAAQQRDAQLLQSGTVKGVEDRIQALEIEKKAIEDNLPALEDQAKKSKEGEAELKKYKDRLAEINKEQESLNNNVLPYLKLKEDEKKAYADAVKGNDEYIKKQKEYADLAATGSSEDVKKRIDSIEREKQAIQDGLPALDSLAESSEEAKQRAIEQRKRIDELNAEEAKLTTEIKAAVEAREAEQKAVEKTKQQAGIVEKLEDDKASIIQKAEDDKQAIIQKGEEERASIIERAAKARADIEDKYGQKLVEIARNAADEAAKALTDLQQKQADLRTSLGRDEEKAAREDADKTLDIQIKAQRAERDALQEHVARLNEIRRSDYAATQKDLLDRNFLSIYQRRLSQNEQIEQENSKFGADRAKRQQSTNDEVQDAQRQAQIARRERLIAFQQQQQDAQLAYQRQLVAAKQAHDKELQLAQEAHVRELAENRKKAAEDLADLQRKTAKELQARQAAETKELAARQAGAVKELQLLEKTEAQRLEIIAKYAKKANDLIANALKASPTKRAGGGYLEVGQASMVNEPESSGRESFNGVPLPGAGLFIPSQAGYVNPNGGGVGKSVSNTNTFYIQAHDTEGVKREVISVLRQVMG